MPDVTPDEESDVKSHDKENEDDADDRNRRSSTYAEFHLQVFVQKDLR